MKEGGTAAQQFDGPDRIGPYQLLAKLAEGGMGAVYLARMSGPAGFTKLAVVKQLKDDLLDSRRFADLFLDEARLAARLTHPNVVHTYGAGEEDGHLYLAMEYLDGQPWSRVQRRLNATNALPLSAQLKVLADTLTGLHYAHGLKGFDGKAFNVVHCDISPQNIFVTYDGQVKVVDFGVARATHNKRDTGDSIFLGKVGYCSPEQARGESVDRRADIFAVGVMLFEALTGQRFAVGEGAVKTLRYRGAGKEPRIRDVAPNVAPELAAICDRALALAPADRYATADEFRAKLVEYMGRSGQGLDGAQLGRLVSQAFEVEAKRVHQLIEKRLEEQTASMRHVADISGGSPAERNDNTLQADLSRLASITRLADEDNVSSIISASLVEAAVNSSTSASLAQPEPRRRSRLWISLFVLLVSGAAFVAAWFGDKLGFSHGLDGQTTTGLAVEAAQHPSKPAEPSSAAKAISVTFSVTPASAHLFLDGSRLDGNPFSASLSPDNTLHTLEATADGFKPEKRSVVFDRDVELALELTPDEAKGQASTSPDGAAGKTPHRTKRRGARPLQRAAAEAVAEADPVPPEPEAAPEETDSAPAQPAPEADKPAGPAKRPGMNIYDEDPY